jgi:hypothetical protein
LISTQAATRDMRPGALSAEASMAIKQAPPPLQEKRDAAHTLHAHVVASVAKHGAVWLSGADVQAYAPQRFRKAVAEARLRRVVGAALSSGGQEWGPDAFLWRLDPAALPINLSERARHALATPRSTFSALCQANGAKVLAPSDDYVKTLQDLYAAAEAEGEAKAGWLPAYDLVVAPGTTLCCRECHARDPLNDITTFAAIATLH